MVFIESRLLCGLLRQFHRSLLTDRRLRSAHVCLYHSMLLVAYLQCTGREIRVTRKELMQLSKIGSIATYQKCIYELVKFGYIEYKPTFNSFIGTKVRLMSLNSTS
jgi:hypothetical protein